MIMDILLWVWYGFAATYTLWMFYLAVMNLQRAHEAKTLSKVALVLGSPILIVGYLLDIFVNVVIMTVLFLELPKQLTMTERLQKHIRTSPSGSWREKLASWFCTNLLDTFDPSGKHC